MTKQPTCEERIQERLQNRLVGYRKLTELVKTGKWKEANEYMWDLKNDILATSKTTVYKVELSWGGPAAWFEVWSDGPSSIERIVFHFSDWFDHAERELQDEEFEAAETFLGPYIQYG